MFLATSLALSKLLQFLSVINQGLPIPDRPKPSLYDISGAVGDWSPPQIYGHPGPFLTSQGGAYSVQVQVKRYDHSEPSGISGRPLSRLVDNIYTYQFTPGS